MKELHKYLGRVTLYRPAPDHSFVTLKDTKSGELYETDGDSARMAAKGIDHDNCEFEVLIMENDAGNVEAIMTKLEPRPVSPETVSEIKKNSQDDGLSDGNFDI
jgi:hypothetical protein